MSRDNTIFYMGNEFPSVEWAAILAEFDAESYPVKDLDRRRGASQRWCFDGVDGQIYVDLVNTISGLHLAPPNCQWMIAIHCNGHIGIQHWFLYSLPILAVSRLGNSILFDPHFPNPGAACTLAGIEHRMHAVLPSRCNIERIAECGYTEKHNPMWPIGVDPSTAVHPRPELTNAVNSFLTNEDCGANWDEVARDAR